jgi:aryl-alcohol dehydrogenase-like predicted oxidoreductase
LLLQPSGPGFLGGRFRSVDDLATGDWRRGNPRFQNETFAANLGLANRLRELAQEKSCTPAQLALARILRRHQDVVPIPGTNSMARLGENARASDVQLYEQDFKRIDEVVPYGAVESERYASEMMKIISG